MQYFEVLTDTNNNVFWQIQFQRNLFLCNNNWSILSVTYKCYNVSVEVINILSNLANKNESYQDIKYC